MTVRRHSYERWIFACDILADGDVPAAVTAKRLLKHIGRTWHIRCRAFSEDERILELTRENKRLKETIAVLMAGEPPPTEETV